jgi:hypothetical protein
LFLLSKAPLFHLSKAPSFLLSKAPLLVAGCGSQLLWSEC